VRVRVRARRWMLPLCGFIGGLKANYIALKMIFLPVERTRFGCFYWQGLFLKRQKEVSAVYARMMAERVLHSRNFWKYMLEGPKRAEFAALTERHAMKFLDALLGNLKPVLLMYTGGGGLETMKELMTSRLLESLPAVMEYGHAHCDRSLDLETEIREKMAALEASEFEAVLHPVFEEDEFKLILIGGVLGMIAGFMQVAYS
jgi:uncharacterized membrane protein YheB (UPF0754 family)